MPSFNCERYIRAAIDSVLAQTYGNLELLICDDCSTDGSVAAIKELCLKDSRIRLFQNVDNLGVAASRNLCIQNSRGRYIAFIDSDDYWMPNKLETQIEFMRLRGAVFSCTAYEKRNEDFSKLISVAMPYKVAGYNQILFSGNPIGNSTVIYDCNSIGKYYAPDIKKRNDFALWLRISRDGHKAYGMPEVLARYRMRRNSLSADKRKLLAYQWRLYHDVESIGFLKSTLAILSWAIIKTFKR